MITNDILLPDKETIQDLRQSIDTIDRAFIELLAERLRATAKICIYKNFNNLSPDRSERRIEDLKKTLEVVEKLHLNPKLIKPFFERIYKEGREMMQELQNSRMDLDELYYINGIENLIASIFHLDLSICYMLVERFRLVYRMGLYKKKNNIKPLASKRWEEILKNRTKQGKKLGISSELVPDLLNMIHNEALRIESEI